MAAAMSEDLSLALDDSRFVVKFALDVVLFNLKVCGHERQFVIEEHQNIVYSRSNFVRIAAVYVLRLCLTYRDKWKPNIKELTKNVSQYDYEFFQKCFDQLLKKALEERKDALQLNVELTLAWTTEMALYLISENRQFDLFGLVNGGVSNIYHFIENPLEQAIKIMTGSPQRSFRQELEKLFYECVNVLEILGWMEEFIQKHAIPYGSTENLSAIFYQEVSKRWKNIVERVYRGEKPPDEAVKINLGFLPRATYNNIIAETSVPMPKYSQVAWGRHSEKPSGSSETGNKSGSGSKQISQAGSSGKDSSKQAPQGGQGGEDSSKDSAQNGTKKEDFSKQATQDVQCSKDSSQQTVEGVQRSKDSSEQTVEGVQRSKDSSEQTVEDVQRSKDSSEQTVESVQSIHDFSDVEMTDVLPEMDLGSERRAQASQGATRKRRISGKVVSDQGRKLP